MAEVSLSALARPLLSLAAATWPRVRQLRAERQVGRAPFATSNDLLDIGLDETLRRLCEGRVEASWWRSLLHIIGHEYVTPDLFRKPAIQEWLSDRQVQADLKTLARARTMATEVDDPSISDRLSASYAKSTGEAERLAKDPIEVVVVVMAVGYVAGMELGQQRLAGMVQDVGHEVRAESRTLAGQIDQLVERFGPDARRVELYTSEARAVLEKIKKCRSVKLDLSRREIRELAHRATEGEYRDARIDVRKEILHWAARLHTHETDALPRATEFKDELLKLDPQADTRIIEALILQTEGDTNGALQLLRDLEGPDAHQVLFGMLRNVQGVESALAWFEEEEGHDSPGFLTGAGWSNVAGAFAESRRWERALQCLSIAENKIEEWPDLLFVGGVLNAAMLLPEDFRGHALQMNIFHPGLRAIEGKAAGHYRERAEVCFERASRALRGIGLDDRAQVAEDWRLWLRLNHPEPGVREEACQTIQEGMSDGKRAVDLVWFARAYQIDYDPSALSQYLTRRERLGGLDAREVAAELALAETTMAPKERAAFLEQEEERLLKAFPMSALAEFKIRAFVEDGQYARARQVLDKHKEKLLPGDHDRFRAMLDSAHGLDPRPELERLYEETGSLIDLHNLANHLELTKDWRSLEPQLRELFQRERTALTALRLVECMGSDPSTSEIDVVAFLDENPDLVEQSIGLTLAFAWALFRAGQLGRARVLNDQLRAQRNNTSDLLLDINLALQEGNWERLPAIVDREWPKREGHDAEVLLRLASLAGEIDVTSERSATLAKLATQKSPDDPRVLFAAFILLIQLGREKDVDPTWLSRAEALSEESSPVHRADLRTVVEKMLPAQRERFMSVERALLQGKLPLHMAASALNTQLSRFLIDLPCSNATCQDGRQRVMLPVISGRRQLLQMRADWSLGLDTTSIMVLHHLDLLEIVLKAFKRIVLPPDTMILLLNERRMARFHQPSRLRSAQELPDLVDEGRLKEADTSIQPPEWLMEEVGADLGELLEAAKAENGCVVRPSPIHRARSFMEEDANLHDYSRLVVSTKEFASGLQRAGHIDAGSYNEAIRYLGQHDHATEEADAFRSLERPIFIDDLAVTYLQGAGLLRAICNRGLDLRVHPSMRSEQDEVIAANREGERVAGELNEIRLVLRSALERDAISFLPRHEPKEEENGLASLVEGAPTLALFFLDAAPCDAVCIDDRSVNANGVFTDRQEHAVPIVCVLDILQHLETRELTDRDRTLVAWHRLRGAGFAFVPIMPDELEARLRAVEIGADSQLVESAELRVLRQSVMCLRYFDMLQLPEEAEFLRRLRLASVLAIRRIWEDTSVPPEHAAVLSDWVWCNVAPSPLDWPPRDHSETTGPAEVAAAFAQHVELLLKPIELDTGRRELLWSWIERAVLEPLLPANSQLFDVIVAAVRSEIERMAEKAEDDFSPDSSNAD